jgi:hypothetical protein
MAWTAAPIYAEVDGVTAILSPLLLRPKRYFWTTTAAGRLRRSDSGPAA